ncbi:MAG TPA: TraR/DksA family transcriptional regulator [Candidatus Polarisedimenticolia bacterium]|nr:TraR/DksA family transcriptional regulator [Candidatus Polarisedimenticolia bacterium]
MRKKLQDKRRALVAAYVTNKNYGRDTEDGDTQDIADKASNAYTKEFLYSLSNTDRNVLQLVDDALERLKHGHFGVCMECGEKMLPKRLDAVPWARHCISCQEREEKGLL